MNANENSPTAEHPTIKLGDQVYWYTTDGMGDYEYREEHKGTVMNFDEDTVMVWCEYRRYGEPQWIERKYIFKDSLSEKARYDLSSEQLYW